MKTILPATEYFPSPTLFTRNLKHFPVVHRQCFNVSLAAAWTFLSSSVVGVSPVPSTVSGSSPLPLDHSSSVLSEGTPSLPAPPRAGVVRPSDAARWRNPSPTMSSGKTLLLLLIFYQVSKVFFFWVLSHLWVNLCNIIIINFF